MMQCVIGERIILSGSGYVEPIMVFVLFYCLQTWSQNEEGDPWPLSRFDHVAACLGYGGQHQRLLISGGFAGGRTAADDMWLLDPQSGRMEKVMTAMNLFFKEIFTNMNSSSYC